MENLERLKTNFSDATEVKLAIKNANYKTVRSLIPKSATILALHISKNYVTLVWSEEAKKFGFPDATVERHIIMDGKASAYFMGDEVRILTTFHPFRQKKLIDALDSCPFFQIEEVNALEKELGTISGKISCSLEENPINKLLKYIEQTKTSIQ